MVGDCGLGEVGERIGCDVVVYDFGYVLVYVCGYLYVVVVVVY